MYSSKENFFFPNMVSWSVYLRVYYNIKQQENVNVKFITWHHVLGRVQNISLHHVCPAVGLIADAGATLAVFGKELNPQHFSPFETTVLTTAPPCCPQFHILF